MKEAVSCRLMKELDSNTIRNKGIPSMALMELAAWRCAEEIERVLDREKREQRILCVCGSGNNGGDGIATARILFLHGYRAEIFMAGNPDHITEETAQQLLIARNYQVPVVNTPVFCEYTVIVDALFGVGLARPIEGRLYDLIREINASSAFKAAVDIPSGINGDTGNIMGTAFRADLTVTFGFKKTGLCLYPGRRLAGRIVVADIGICREESLMENKFCPEDKDILRLPGRSPEGNKGTFGKVLAAAGSEGMCGAAYFAAAAALASGAGMVRVLTEEANRAPLQTALPEAIVDIGETDEAFEKAYRWCDVLILGPGLGLSEKSRRKTEWFLQKAREDEKPLILDADGLNLLSVNPKWKKYLGEHVILTPHMGEMSRLTGKSISELQEDRAEAAKSLAAETKAVCVLKDACTVTAGADGSLYYNLSGNPGMAAAGSGDVLSGVLAGMECMYIHEPEKDRGRAERAALGVFIHGRAGDLASKEKGQYGMKAGDLIPAVSRVMEYGGEYEKI